MGKKGKKSRGPRPFPPTNFCLYYEPLARDAEDHAALLAAMQRPLPIAFRAAGDALSAAATGAELAARFGGVAALTALGWRAGAWRLACSRAQLRADPSLAAMHAWLVSRHEVGAVRRQEEASMLSVALLGTQPGERVADLCAAPGSKSSELADRLGPSGLLIANDNDLKRCWMLSHTMCRFTRPSLVVTNHEAQCLPALPPSCGRGFDRVLCDVPCSGDGTLRKARSAWERRGWKPTNGASLHPLQLAIARRGLELLRPGGTLVYSTCSLNPLENEAVVAALLAEGGCQLLDAAARVPHLELRPGITRWRVANQHHPQWKQTGAPAEAAGREEEEEEAVTPLWFDSVEQAVAAQEGKAAGSGSQSSRPSFFPPPPGSAIAQQLPLCARLLPQDNDTGGFFAAVFCKREVAAAVDSAPSPSSPVVEEPADEAVPVPVHGGGGGGGPTRAPPRPARQAGKHLDLPHAVPTGEQHTAPFDYAAARFPADMAAVGSFYGLPPGLIGAADDEAAAAAGLALLCRSARELHKVYALTPQAASAVLLPAEAAAGADDDRRLYEVVSAGTAVLERSRTKLPEGVSLAGGCQHRLCSDAQTWAARYFPTGSGGGGGSDGDGSSCDPSPSPLLAVAGRTLWLEREEWAALLRAFDPKHAPERTAVLGPATAARADQLGLGCVLLRLRPSSAELQQLAAAAAAATGDGDGGGASTAEEAAAGPALGSALVARPETALVGWVGHTTLLLFSANAELSVLREMYCKPASGGPSTVEA